MKTYDRIAFKLFGRGVLCLKPLDIDKEGKVNTIRLMTVKERANSLIDKWDVKGWEKVPGKGLITIIDAKGISQSGYVLSEAGQTQDIYVGSASHVNLEDVIGKAAMVDDISDALDLNKSLKQMVIGLLIGIGLGAFILGPMLTKMMS
jgi:hypothetical protein